MAEEVKITPDAEVIAPVAGTVEVEVVSAKSEAKAPETVPLAVYLDLKEDLKNLKHEIKESKGVSKETVAVEGYDTLKQKYPDVSPEFIQDMLTSATSEATKKIEAKYSPIIEKQEIEKKQQAFDVAFDSLFEKTLKENPDLPSTIDKETIKTLATTEKYRNTPLAEILTKMYPVSNTGKQSSENDTRASGDKIEDMVSFNKITAEQKSAILDDPKARTKYFNWLDTQIGR